MGSKLTFPKKTLRSIPVEGKTVLVRVDYNVPLNPDGSIADDYRITASLPTIQYLLERGCRVVLMSHLGRPNGERTEKDSLSPVAQRLGELLSQDVALIPECIGDQVVQAVKQLPQKAVILLENLRFHPEEEANDDAFAARIAKDTAADYFVQDGFGVVHRAHASTDAITRHIPSASGLLIEREWLAIEGAMRSPERPFVAVLGGAKISDKIGVIEKLVATADVIIIGGAMANAFLQYRGHPIGKSKTEPHLEGVIKNIYAAAEAKVGKAMVDEFLQLPVDVAIAPSADDSQRRVTVNVDDVMPDDMILDIGPESILRATAKVAEASTVVWNGTMGMAELKAFSYGSARIAMAMASNPAALTVVGGGDTADFVLHWDARRGESFAHVSTGGGASLDLMSGMPMPGIDALLSA